MTTVWPAGPPSCILWPMKENYVYKPVRFYLIVNLIVWLAWLAAAYFSYQGGQGGWISLFLLIGLFGPFLTSLWFIFTSGSRELKQNYFERLFNLRLIWPVTLLPIVLILPLSAVLSVWLSNLFFGLPWSQLTLAPGGPFSAGLFSGAVLLLLAPLVEELGWRGYGVDSLRGRRTFLTATLIYGALWACWHLPTFFINGYYQNLVWRENPLFALNFMVSVIPAAVLINWLWYKNKGSILTAVLFHFVFDLQGLLQMGQVAKCIETGVLIVLAVIVVYRHKFFFAQFAPRIGDYGS